MNSTISMPEEFLLHIKRDIEIAAPADIVFASLLEQIGEASDMPDGTPMPMKIEPWPGGRWYRDLGNNAGHFWGHVQVIKLPKLLEICGPLPMSYAAINHVQWRITEQNGRSTLTVTHRAMGEIPQEHKDGMPEGWEYELKKIKQFAEQKKKK